MARFRFMIAAACIALATIPGHAKAEATESTLDKIMRTGEIAIGFPPEAMPFSYYNRQNKPIGYSIDLCESIVDSIKSKLGLKKLQIVYRPLKFSERLPAVKNRMVDLECGSTTNTTERRDVVGYSVSTFAADIKSLVRVDYKGSTIFESSKEKIIVVDGTTVGALVSKLEKNGNVVFNKIQVPNLQAGFAALESGTGDILVFDQVVTATWAATNPGKYKFLPEILDTEYLGIIMDKDDRSLKNLVDERLKELMRSGKAKEIYVKWFGSRIEGGANLKNGVNLNIPFSKKMNEIFARPTDGLPSI